MEVVVSTVVTSSPALICLWVGKLDQFQVSPAASPEIASHSMKNLAFHSLLKDCTSYSHYLP